jgi:hypothetical protein
MGTDRHFSDNADTRTGRLDAGQAARFSRSSSEKTQVSGPISALLEVAADDHPLDLIGSLEDLRSLAGINCDGVAAFS